MKSIQVLANGGHNAIGDLGVMHDLRRRTDALQLWEVSAYRGQRAPSLSGAAFRAALELRYQVYCLERGFLPCDAYPDGAETDEHDESAKHFFAHDQFGELVGYVRLVSPDAMQQFPFQRHCPPWVDGMALPAPSEAAEVSRLIVRSDFRRLRSAQPSAHNLKLRDGSRDCSSRRQDSQQILSNLYRQMYAYSQAVGIQYWYAAMERPLARALMLSSFAFKPIGPQSDYYGPVAPYLADLRAFEGANEGLSVRSAELAEEE